MLFHVIRGDSKAFKVEHAGAVLEVVVMRIPGRGLQQTRFALTFEPGTFEDKGEIEHDGKTWRQIDHAGSTLRLRCEVEPTRSAEKNDPRFRIAIDAPRAWHFIWPTNAKSPGS